MKLYSNVRQTLVWALILMLLGSGCITKQASITGEPILYGINNYTGDIIDRDLFPEPVGGNALTGNVNAPGAHTIGIVPHKDEIIAVIVDNIFVRYLKETITSPHVLIWTETYDDGSDNPQNAYTRILYNAPNQPEGVHLGLADRIVYGPTLYKGHPIRIKLFIVELDKKEKEIASRIIEAVGQAASAAKPEAAPAISVATKFAQTIGAMNEDDYELRYDLTLSPIGPFARYTINKESDYAPKWGDPFDPDKQKVEPAQRERKEVSVVTSLRTGSFTIIKRELGTRTEVIGWNQKIAKVSFAVSDPSQVDMDYTQESFLHQVRLVATVEDVLHPYKRLLEQSETNNTDSKERIRSELRKVAALLEHKADLRLENGIVESVLKYQGGYFYRITSGLRFNALNSTLKREDAELIDRALHTNFKNGRTYIVKPFYGPNKGLDIAEGIGRREFLRDKTHLVFSLVSGLPLGVSSETMRTASSSDAQRLQELLDTPPDGIVLSDMTGRIDEVATTVNTLLKKRKYADLAARRVMRDPEFRRSLDYPLFWIGLLEISEPNITSDTENRNSVALNASILSTLSDLVVNLPMVEADNFDQIAKIKKLTSDDFEEPAGNNHGLFRITTSAAEKIADRAE